MLKRPIKEVPVKRWFGAPGMVAVDLPAMQAAMRAAKAMAQAASHKQPSATAQPVARHLPSLSARLTATPELGQAEHATDSKKRPAEDVFLGAFCACAQPVRKSFRALDPVP